MTSSSLSSSSEKLSWSFRFFVAPFTLFSWDFFGTSFSLFCCFPGVSFTFFDSCWTFFATFFDFDGTAFTGFLCFALGVSLTSFSIFSIVSSGWLVSISPSLFDSSLLESTRNFFLSSKRVFLFVDLSFFGCCWPDLLLFLTLERLTFSWSSYVELVALVEKEVLTSSGLRLVFSKPNLFVVCLSRSCP